jgi:glycosyltransferase involved in cell wall biosynthesis
MNTPPKVTVATVAFNAARFIEDTIRGLQAQTFTHYEHIIIDDGSTDATFELCEDLARDDPRIRVIANPENLGIARSRNAAVAAASGRFLAWNDAEDISVPTRLEHQLALLEAQPGIGIVGGYLEFFDGSGPISVRTYPTDNEQLRAMLYRFSPVSQGAAMIRLDVLRRCGEYDMRHPAAEDLDMLFRIAAISRLANLPEVVLRYRQVASSATFTKLRTMERHTLAIRRAQCRGPIHPSAVDVLFNLAHTAAMYLLPARVKLELVARFRNRPL